MKTIAIGTKITFNATSDKYSIIEQTATGFQFKPIKFEKGLPTVPRTFEEVKEEFLSSQIDIEGFEHNDADNRLVELLMDIYIKETLIGEYKNSITGLTEAKNQLSETIKAQTNTIAENDKTILAHEATISEQQEVIQEQKNAIQGYKDSITAKEKEINELKSKISTSEAQFEKEKNEWEIQEEKYKSTIEGLEAMVD